MHHHTILAASKAPSQLGFDTSFGKPWKRIDIYREGMGNPESNLTDGNIRTEENPKLQDIEWLSSLSEPELDFLISLKEMATKRARNAGCKDLGDKFDLRMLRALGVVLLEHFKERVQASSEIVDSTAILKLLNSSNLSILNDDDDEVCSNSPTKDEIDLSFIGSRRRRMWDELCKETPTRNKRKNKE